MAIMVIFDGAGFVERNYDHLRAAIGWDAEPAAGCHLHLLGSDEAGLLDVQIWESRAQFDAYLETRFLPAFDALRLPRPTAPRILDFYNGAQSGEAERLVPLLAATLVPA